MMKPKYLLISCATMKAGGAERVLSILSKPFADNFKRVVYVMWLHADVFYSIDSRVELLDIENEVGSKNLFKKMLWFRKYVQKERPDLLLSFLYPWSMKVIISLIFTPFKIIVAERRAGDVVRGGRFTKVLRHLLYLRAEGILLQTEGNRKHYGGRLAPKVDVIYNPIKIPQELVGVGLTTEKEDVIVTVGSLKPEKNHELLIRSFADFHRTYPNYRLVIYGDGPKRRLLEQLITDLQMNDFIQMPGNTNEVFTNIASSRMFVLSSDVEGMPNALIEAMCVGLPCISTKVSGATDLIQSGENGILIDIGNHAQLVSAMIAIADNEKLANAMATRAVEVYQKTNANYICKKWIHYLNSKM